MSVIDRFFDKINFKGENGCHLWTAAKNHCGYGRFQVKRKHI